MIRYFSFICIFVFLFSKVYSDDEFLDLSSLIDYRTQQYPLLDADQIYLNTPKRTGSTLVYNVLRFLFENNDSIPKFNDKKSIVVKNHKPILKNDKKSSKMIYVTTIRNPIDACFSSFRVIYSIKKDFLETDELNSLVKKQVDFAKFIKKLILTERVIVLKYEEFDNNFDFLFETIENQFHISIDINDKNFLKNALSKQNVSMSISKLTDFSQKDKLSFFHGDHIDKNNLPDEIKHNTRNALSLKLRKYSKLFSTWGYDLTQY